ncbi:hypothetical protein D3C75_479610 [compost metagenome]
MRRYYSITIRCPCIFVIIKEIIILKINRLVRIIVDLNKLVTIYRGSICPFYIFSIRNNFCNQ